MAKTWREVKARKEQLARASGRDIEAARIAAKNRTVLYVLGAVSSRGDGGDRT